MYVINFSAFLGKQLVKHLNSIPTIGLSFLHKFSVCSFQDRFLSI